MKNYSTSVSKMLSYVLRHNPGSIGLTLDEHGWANVDELIAKSKPSVTFDEIVAAVENNEKKRFTLEGRRIRAKQGHSVDVDVQLKVAIPPPVLYHGTVSKVIGLILKEGLKPMKRQHVHLSADVETASSVGSRRGKPIILKIQTHDLVKDNHKFYLSENGVWLTSHIPPKDISQ